LEGQRGGAGFEVLDPGLCPEWGQWGELGFTLEAARWGRRDGAVQIPTWRVEERGRERVERILARSWHGWAQVSSLSLSLSHFSNSNKAMADTFPRVVLISKCMVGVVRVFGEWLA
jgi:hypothetical protein